MICLIVFSLQANAFRLLEDAIETESLRLTLEDDNTGYVQGKICDDCKMLTVAITPETRAFHNNHEVTLKRAATRVGQPATVFINIEHTKVTRIIW
jgi:hypothetical protein